MDKCSTDSNSTQYTIVHSIQNGWFLKHTMHEVRYCHYKVNEIKITYLLRRVTPISSLQLWQLLRPTPEVHILPTPKINLSQILFCWPAFLYNIFQMKPTRCTLLLSIFISTSLHVSGNYVPIISRTYWIYATLVFFTLYGWLTGLRRPDTHPYCLKNTSILYIQ